MEAYLVASKNADGSAGVPVGTDDEMSVCVFTDLRLAKIVREDVAKANPEETMSVFKVHMNIVCEVV